MLVSQPVDGQPAVLAFTERKLAGILQLTISDDDQITAVHVRVEEATLKPLRAQLLETY